MRVYIINASDLIVTREAPVEPGEDEIIVGSLEELRAARLSGKRLLALWNGLPGVARLSKVGERDALVDRLWAALEALPDPQPVRACARTSRCNWICLGVRADPQAVGRCTPGFQVCGAAVPISLM